MYVRLRHVARLVLWSGVAAALLELGTASGARAQGLILTGYADLEAVAEDLGSGDAKAFFDNHHFNLIAIGNIIGDLFGGAEVEIEHGGAEIALEYGFLMYTGIPHARVTAGKFIVPFGRFNKDLHPSWISKVPGRPEGFSRVLPATYSDVGVLVSGGIPLGVGTLDRVTYDVFVLNGLQGDPGADIRGMRPEGEPGDEENDAKSVGGRLGLVLGNGLDFAGSVYRGKYNQEEGLYLTFVGADAAYYRNGFELRGEWVTALQDVVGDDELTKTGFYVQGSYLVQDRVEPTVRFSWQNFPAAQELTRDLWRVEVGGSYYVSPSSSVRFYYRHNGERKADPEPENDSVIAQFNIVF